MSDTHSYSFFGQKVGLIIQSSSNSEPFIFFRFIKSKGDGSWEKPSSGEGRGIKFSLEEAMEYIRNDEYIEVTPNFMRIRKIYLDEHERKRQAKTIS